MKILILPSWYPNTFHYYGTFFQEQAQFLTENGLDVKVMMAEELNTKSYGFQKLKRILKCKHIILNTDFLIQRPDAYSFPVIIQKSWSDEKKLIAMEKAYLKAFMKLSKKLNWFPDIIHLQGMFKYGLSSYKIAEKYSIPLVVIEHSPFKLTNYKRAYQMRIKRIFSIAKRIAGVSHFHKSHLAMVDSNRDMEVVWNFMDEQKFSYQASLKQNGIFIITTILRASYEKDPITFFDAVLKFIQIYKNDRPVEVNVVGLNCLDDLKEMKNIDKNVISKYDVLHKILKFHFWLDRDKIIELHQKSSVYVSTSTYESYGAAIREAMLCGTPVISTKSGGPEDTLGNGNGILIEIGDSDAIANSLLSIYEGNASFRSEQIRDLVIAQSGSESFLSRMKKFYKY